MTHELKIFGDNLLFDDQPIASIAHLHAGVRMMLVEALHAQYVEPEPLDLRGCDQVQVVVDVDGKVMYRHFPGPPLPEGCGTSTVVHIHEVESACEEVDLEVLTDPDSMP